MLVFKEDYSDKDSIIEHYLDIIKNDFCNKSYYEVFMYMTNTYRVGDITQKQFNVIMLRQRDNKRCN